jgi:hypothetical protein
MIGLIISAHCNIQGSAVICTDNLVAQYSVPAMPGSLYTWNITGGNLVSGQNTNSVIVEWDACTAPPCSGSIAVNYVNTFFGCPDGNSQLDIAIKPSIEVWGDQTICSGGSAKYNIVNDLGIALEWVLLDQNGSPVYGPMVQTPLWSIPATVTATLTPGSYTVQVSDLTGAYCTPVENYSLTINPLPPAPTALTGEMKPCAGASYLYTCTPFNPSNILNWTITGGNPATGNGTSLSVSWGGGSTYGISVKETDPNTGCSSAAITLTPLKKVFINPGPCALTEDVGGTAVPVSLDCTSPTPTGKACLNTSKTYKIANWSTYNIDQYEVSIFPEVMGTIVSTTLNAANELVINVQWNNMSNNSGTPFTYIRFKTHTCGGTNPLFSYKLVIKGGEPISISGPNPACDNVPATFNITPQPAPGTYTTASYIWTWGDGTGAQQAVFDPLGISHTYAIGGTGISTFPITVQLNVDGCLSSSSTSVGVNPGPGAYITSSAGCYNGSPVTLTALPAGQSNYQWSTGATTSSITINAVAMYSVTITGANGCVDREYITIDPCPTLCPDLIGYSINFNPPVLNASCGSVTISGSISGGAITGYQINWGDGAPAYNGNSIPSFNESHTYAQHGTYNVCLTVFNIINGVVHCYSQCVPVTVPVKAAIYATISCPSPATITSYNFTFNTVAGSTTPLSSYQWLFDGNGAGSGAVSNTVAVSPTGNHTVSVLITTSGGYSCTETAVLNQQLIPTPPGAAFTIAPNPPFCQKQTVVNFNFSGSLSQVHHALWTFGDGASYAPIYPTTVPHIDAQRVYDAYTFPNTKTVDLYVYDNYGCVYTDDDDVTVYENKLNGYPIPPLNTFCPGASANLSYYPDLLPGVGNSITPTGYVWSTGAVTPSLPVYSTGQYYITVFDAASGCKYESPRFADVAVKNVPNLMIRGKSDYCEGEEIFFNGASGSGTYLWTYPPALTLASGSSITSSSIKFSPPANGTYTVTLSLTTNGCTTTSAKTFTVHAPPDVPTVTVTPSPGCENNDVLLTVSNWASPLILNWSQGGNTNPIVVHNTGNYNAMFTDPLTGCTSQSNNVKVNANPDLSWLISGCLDRCDNDQNHIVIPGSYGISYARWTWMVNSQYLGAPYSGNASAVSDLDLNDALAGGGTLPPGSYIVQIELVNDVGCKIVTDPIYVTVRTCPCKIDYVRENGYRCLGTDLNGQSFYHFQFTVHFNNFTPTGTFALTPSPVGGGTNVTPWTYQVNGNDVVIEGILGYYAEEILPCFTLTYTDPDPAMSCTYTFCVRPPQCPTPNCNWSLEREAIDCISRDANGNQTYAVYLNVNPQPGNWNVMYSLQSGTITGLPATLTGGTATPLQGIYTDLPPVDRQLCLYINFYDITTGQYCFTYHCYDLPDCKADEPGNGGRMAAGMLTKEPAEPQLTVLPNPAKEEAFAHFAVPETDGQTASAVLTLTNAQGKVINIKHVLANTGYAQYNTAPLPPGIYYITLSTSNKKSVTQKITVIK